MTIKTEDKVTRKTAGRTGTVVAVRPSSDGTHTIVTMDHDDWPGEHCEGFEDEFEKVQE